jgi:hypothetical protein
MGLCCGSGGSGFERDGRGFGGWRFDGRCRSFGERFERRVLVLARVEQAGAEVVVRAVGVEAEAAVMDDAAQLELQLDRLQGGGRAVQAERRFDDLPSLLDGLGDGGIALRHPGPPKLLHP